jgi:hypothetical protein
VTIYRAQTVVWGETEFREQPPKVIGLPDLSNIGNAKCEGASLYGGATVQFYCLHNLDGSGQLSDYTLRRSRSETQIERIQ